MISYHGQESIKCKYLTRFLNAVSASEVVVLARRYDECGDENVTLLGGTLGFYGYKYFSQELGIPQWLLRLVEEILLGMNEAEGLKFAERFLNAVPVGVDLNTIKSRLVVARMNRLLTLVDLEKYRGEIILVRSLHTHKIVGDASENNRLVALRKANDLIRRENYASVQYLRDCLVHSLSGEDAKSADTAAWVAAYSQKSGFNIEARNAAILAESEALLKEL